MTQSAISNIVLRKSWTHVDWDGPPIAPNPWPRGSQLRQSDLTDEDIVEILTRAAAGESQASIAQDKRLSQASISRIVRRQRWTHVKWPQ